jgi:hypothetical protein
MTGDSNCPEGFRRYYPLQNANKVDHKYNFYISADESVIYKNNNQSSLAFSTLISNQESFVRFGKILNGSIFEEVLRKHICDGFDLEKDGSYKSRFMHGYRLDLIHTYEISEEKLQIIYQRCDILLENLEYASSNNELYGDWALHNLVYSLNDNCIINIDLEGFLTYNPLPEWADFSIIKTWIQEVQTEITKSFH